MKRILSPPQNCLILIVFSLHKIFAWNMIFSGFALYGGIYKSATLECTAWSKRCGEEMCFKKNINF